MSELNDYALPDWPCAWGGPLGTGELRKHPDDFIVEETLPFLPEGMGEHVFLQIEKVGENTDYVARVLARFAGVRQRDVGFAGLKDRHARTTQWFSVWMPGKQELDWNELGNDSIKVRQAVRHARKLKRGTVQSNHFQIRIRNWQGDREQTALRLQQIAENGYPNYFGEQRFGRHGDNVSKALVLANGKKLKREQQGIYLSAIRSFLFNQVLAERVREQNWNQALSGDICKLNSSNSQFKVDTVDGELQQRMSAGDIHATGPLWGDGDAYSDGLPGEIEHHVFERYSELIDILLKYGLEMDRRALRIMPIELTWEFPAQDELLLSFGLPAGGYATSLLREVVTT